MDDGQPVPFLPHVQLPYLPRKGHRVPGDVAEAVMSLAGKTYFKSITLHEINGYWLSAQTKWAERSIKAEIASVFKVAKYKS